MDAAQDVADFMAGAEEDEEEVSQEEPAVGKKGKRAANPQVKAKAKAKTPPKTKAVKKRILKNKGDHGGWRKCKQCTVWKELDEFNDQQASCKECFNDRRSLRRVAERQNMTEEIAAMERDDPKQHSALVKQFVKERNAAKKDGTKLKFCIHKFKVSYRSRVGVRSEAEGEMMWEGEWLEVKRQRKNGKSGWLTKTK